MKRRKDGRWLKVVTVNGKKLYFYSTADTERKAENDIKKQLLEYKEEEERGKTFEEAAEEWSREHFENLENNSMKVYRPATRCAVEYFGNSRINELAPRDIAAYVEYLCAKHYAHKTVKNRLMVVNLIFKFAVVRGYTLYNPCANVSIPKNLKKESRSAPTEDEIQIVLSNINSSQAGFLAAFILLTGCRRGEVLALTYGDYDKDSGSININKTVEWLGNIPQIKNHPKTESGNRIIPVPDILRAKLSGTHKKSELIFPNSNGELFHNANVTRLWDKYRLETGLTLSPHELRHGYATLLHRAEVDAKTAQELLGHSNIQTTLDIYTHIDDRRKSEAITKLEKIIVKS